MTLHVTWTATPQPATRYRLAGTPRRMWITLPAHATRRCGRCGRWRYLKNMLVIEQAYYDPWFYCRVCPPKKTRRKTR